MSYLQLMKCDVISVRDAAGREGLEEEDKRGNR